MLIRTPLVIRNRTQPELLKQRGGDHDNSQEQGWTNNPRERQRWRWIHRQQELSPRTSSSSPFSPCFSSRFLCTVYIVYSFCHETAVDYFSHLQSEKAQRRTQPSFLDQSRVAMWEMGQLPLWPRDGGGERRIVPRRRQRRWARDTINVCFRYLESKALRFPSSRHILILGIQE